jgi:hypothetical protein
MFCLNRPQPPRHKSRYPPDWLRSDFGGRAGGVFPLFDPSAVGLSEFDATIIPGRRRVARDAPLVALDDYAFLAVSTIV